MGRVADLFSLHPRRDSPTNKASKSAAVDLPPRPIWALATEPKQVQTGFGPRNPGETRVGSYVSPVTTPGSGNGYSLERSPIRSSATTVASNRPYEQALTDRMSRIDLQQRAVERAQSITGASATVLPRASNSSSSSPTRRALPTLPSAPLQDSSHPGSSRPLMSDRAYTNPPILSYATRPTLPPRHSSPTRSNKSSSSIRSNPTPSTSSTSPISRPAYSPTRSNGTLYPQAVPLPVNHSRPLPTAPRGTDLFRQTVPNSPTPPSITFESTNHSGERKGGLGLGRPSFIKEVKESESQKRIITPLFPGSFPKSSTLITNQNEEANVKTVRKVPKWIPNKSSNGIIDLSNDLAGSFEDQENLTPSKESGRTNNIIMENSNVAHSPNRPKIKIQCSGTTTSNKRCTRTIDTFPTLDSRLNEFDLPNYCFQHLKNSLSEPGFFLSRQQDQVDIRRREEEWIRFDDWILDDLDERTKVALRGEMKNRVREGDGDGYLYIHEFPPTSTNSSTTLLKIGRSIKPLSRLSQWKNQCPSRIPIIRDILPRSFSSQSSLLNGVQFAEKGTKNHHKWERLVLIEINGRSLKRNREGCIDCGKRHCEMFEVEKGGYENWVREVVERWERWCRDVL